MKEYYGLLDSLSKKAGGPYRFSSILIRRVRQLVKGSLGAFRPKEYDPVSIAFEEYGRDELEVTGEAPPLELIQVKVKGKGKKGKK